MFPQEEGWKDQRGTEPKVTSEVVMLEGQEYHVLGEEAAALAQNSLKDSVQVKTLYNLKQGEDDTSCGKITPHLGGLLF